MRPDTPSSPPPAVAGYEILERVGAGGMGVVHRALQLEPVRREVALKWLRPGLQSAELLARFEREREALARLEHANIARLYETGVTAEGQPWFAMEWVDGVPLLDYADSRSLEIDARIDLVQQVCAGVEHAHRKGVLHRDLKSANILVCELHGRATAKIIDFGLSRFLAAASEGGDDATRLGRVVGTPESMAPEQCSASAGSVDARADQYALGSLLYELLCGVPYLDFTELRRSGIASLYAAIREREAVLPSRRMHSGDDPRARAAARSTTPRSLERELRGDLDWITAKALAKDPEERYATTAMLAADLQRHRAHEPVQAGPPSFGYRCRKFVRRNKGTSLVGALVLAALLAGLVGSAFGFLAAAEREQRFERLAIVVLLERAQVDAGRLAFSGKESVPGLRQWFETHEARLIAAHGELDAALKGLRRGEPFDEASRERERENHELYPQLQRLRAEREAGRLAAAVAAGEAPFVPAEDVFDPEERMFGVNARLQKMTGIDREDFGQERRGLALATSLLQMPYLQQDETRLLLAKRMHLDGLFATGQVEQARERLAEMLVETREEPYRLWLKQHGAAWEESLARDETRLRDLDREIQDLEEGLFERTWWSPSERFLHDRLSELGPRLKEFEEEFLPMMRRRLEWAEQVDALTENHPNATVSWEDARRAIAKADGIVANELYSDRPIDLQPQLGLVPLGMNPRTKLWEFYHLRSAWDFLSGQRPADIPIPAHDDEGGLPFDERLGMVFVLMPGGAFLSGTQSQDASAPNFDQWANPQQTVEEVDMEPYFLARTEMTQTQWLRLCGGENPCRFPAGAFAAPEPITLAYPVENITWNDCRLVLEPYALRLPTWAEWERAGRGGTQTMWHTGDDEASLEGFANYHGREHYDRSNPLTPAPPQLPAFSDGYLQHAPCGTFAPNAYGFHDIHGNVHEFCSDEFPDNPQFIGARGGSFSNHAGVLRFAGITPANKDLRNGDLGLRPARSLEE